MNATRRGRPATHQPQLPLLPSGNERVTGHAEDEEWRLDDQTRQIGKRGVALARARLLGGGAGAGVAGAGGVGGVGGAGSDGAGDAGGRGGSGAADNVPAARAKSATDRRRGGHGPTGRAA